MQYKSYVKNVPVCYPTLPNERHVMLFSLPMMKHFPRYWPFVWGIHRSPVNSTHKGQWRGALMFSLICVWINVWVNNGEAGDLRRCLAHYDATVMCHYWSHPLDQLCTRTNVLNTRLFTNLRKVGQTWRKTISKIKLSRPWLHLSTRPPNMTWHLIFWYEIADPLLHLIQR